MTDSSIAAMIHAVGFIEAHLKEDVAVSDVAEAVSYSLYHFCRMFNRVVRHTPYDYLMRRRLAESARELIQSGKKIVDVAFEYRFNSHETFSRAFKRVFALQPHLWRQQGIVDRRCLMPRLTPAHIQHVNRADGLRPVLTEKAAFTVTGVMGLVEDDSKITPRLWCALGQELEEIGEASTESGLYGVVYYPTARQRRDRFYLAAVAGEYGAISQCALVEKRFPPARYARFIHTGAYTSLELTRDYIYHTWLPKSGAALGGAFEIESHGRDFPGFAETEIAIDIPIVWSDKDTASEYAQMP